MKMISSLTVSLMVTSLLSWTNVQFQSKAKKSMICFSGIARITLNSQLQKFLFHFQFQIEKVVYTS